MNKPAVAAPAEKPAPVLSIRDGMDGKSKLIIPTLDEAISMLKQAKDRNQISEISLSYLNILLKRSALFLVKGSFIEGWAAQGDDISQENVLKVEIPINVDSMFKTVIDTKKYYLGEVPNNPFSKRIINLIGGKPKNIFLFPIVINDFVFAIFYGDNGDGAAIEKEDIRQIPQLLYKVGEAFERLIHSSKYYLSAKPGGNQGGPEL